MNQPIIYLNEVFNEELVLISDMTTTSLEELKTKPFLCFSKGCGYRARLEKWYKDENVDLQKTMEFGTLETILSSVMVGLGVTFVPKSTVSRLIKKGHIHYYKLPDEYSKINTIFIRRSDAYMTSTIEKFIETIEDYRGGASRN
mgnify:CR=1 FL=1